MKKAIVLFLFALVIIGFSGCNGLTTLPATTTTGEPITTTTTTEATESSTQTTALTSATTDTDPVISGAVDRTIEKNSTFSALEGVTAYDAEDQDITSSISVTGMVNPNAEGEYDLTYTVVDSDGNVASVTVTITVVFTDTQGPLLSGTGDVTIYVGEDFDPLEGVSANDTVDGERTVNVTGTVDVWTVGDYTLEYSASDLSENESTDSRIVTVTFGDFEFKSPTTYADTEFTLTEGVYSSPAISGGIINPNLADFSYVKVDLTISADVAGTVDIALGTLPGSAEEIEVTTTPAEHTIYFVFTEALTDNHLVITASGITPTFSAEVSFAEIKDTIAPVLTIPHADFSYPVGYSETGLLALLEKDVTALDNIDGNVTDDIDIDISAVNLAVADTYQVVYSVSDLEGNEATQTIDVTVSYAIDSGYLSDPTFQNLGDGQWHEKSNDGEASINYNPTEGAMEVTIISLGGWASAAGAYLSEPTSGLEIDQWYMFTFTVKTTINRQLMMRMGLETDQANGWIDDFDGHSSGVRMNITADYVTYNYFFKLDSLTSSNGSDVFKIELNLGNIDYSNVGVGGVTSFKDVYIYKLVNEYVAPTITQNHGENLPVKLTVGDALPDFTQYVNAKDMSNAPLTVTVDSSQVDMNTAGTYTVTFSCTDTHDLTTTYSIDFEVIAVANADIEAPEVTLNPGVITVVDQFTQVDYDLRTFVSAIDNVDGAITITSDMINDGGLDLDVAGEYAITYRVYDLSGNVRVFTVNAVVLDKEVPSIAINDMTIDYGADFDPLAGLVVTDNVDGTIDNADVVVTGTDVFVVGGKAMVSGSFEVTYTVSDSRGNEAVKKITVRVMEMLWDDDNAQTMGTPDEGPTHSTAAYNATEEAMLITDIDIDVDPWDHARWVYYFNDTELDYGRTYKFVITAKATTATDLYFRIGTTLSADPWIDNFSGGDNAVVSITDTYQTYEVVFTVDKDSFLSLKSAKFQFMYGYLSTDVDNTIYIKEFKLVPEKLPEHLEIADLLGNNDEINNSTITQDPTTGEVTISDIQVSASARLVYYFSDAELAVGDKYRILITVKADAARDLQFWIGTTLSAEPWIDSFLGADKQVVSITDTYATYEVIFTVNKENFASIKSAKFQFQYGLAGDDPTNKIYISEFKLEKLVYVDYVLVDDFTYADEAAFEAAWTQRTNGGVVEPSELLDLDPDKDAMVFEMPAAANEGWHTARRFESLTNLGCTEETKYLAFYMKNDLNKTSAHVWFYWTDNQNSVAVEFPEIGETGWVFVDIASCGKAYDEIIDFAFGFNNWSSSPFAGSITVYEIVFVSDPDMLGFIEADNKPVVSMSAVNQEALSGLTLKAGDDISTLEAMLLGVLEINDVEDGAITPTVAMIDYDGLVLTDPAMGSYNITVQAMDSVGQLSNALVVPVSIVTVIEDFESYVDDADFKANSDLNAFRTSSGSWSPSSGQLVPGDNNVLEVTYGQGTNGIKYNVSIDALKALGAEYVGIYMKTTSELAGTPKFQAFSYTSSGYAEIYNLQGMISATDLGTYVYVPIGALDSTIVSISILINIGTGNTGTLTLDNIVIK